MSKTRQSRFSTVFVIALFFCLIAQSLLLGPNINTRVFSSIPSIWITVGGWIIFILFLLLFSTFVFDLRRLIRMGIFIASVMVLVISGYLAQQLGSWVNVVLSLTLAAGIVYLAFDIPSLPGLIFQDMLTLLVLLINGIIGVGFLFFPENLILPTSNVIFTNITYILGVLFLGTIAVGIIVHKNRRILNGHFSKAGSVGCAARL